MSRWLVPEMAFKVFQCSRESLTYRWAVGTTYLLTYLRTYLLTYCRVLEQEYT